MPSVWSGLIPRHAAARAAAEARAKSALRIVGSIALEMTQEWLAADSEYRRACREALGEYAEAVGSAPSTAFSYFHPGPSEPMRFLIAPAVELDAHGRPIMDAEFEP